MHKNNLCANYIILKIEKRTKRLHVQVKINEGQKAQMAY